MQNEFSLIWLEEGQPEYNELSVETQNDLDINYICEKLTDDKEEMKIIKKQLIKLNSNPDVIEYRAAIFEELLKNKSLRSSLLEFVKELKILDDYKKNKIKGFESSSIWQLINRLRELETYITCIKQIKSTLEQHDISSEGLKKLKDIVTKVYNDSRFEYLQKDIKNLTEDVAKIKSLTLGVNLDQNLEPCEVQLVSINESLFKNEDSSLLKNFFSALTDGFSNTLIKNSSNEIDPLMNGLTRRVETLLDSVVRNLKRTLDKYIDINGYEIVKLIPELIFYLRFAEMTEKIQNSGLPMSRAKISGDRGFKIEEFYNIKLAMHINSMPENIIKNDIEFNNSHRQYILTGPNRGGKTILTQGIGLCFLLFSNGIYVPGQNANISPTDNIFTHFPADENKTVQLGRLGEESKRLNDIISNATSESLILLNESLSTTSFSEGLYIAKDIVKAIHYLGARMIFNTHMHELAEKLEELNEENIDGKISSMIMGIEGKERTFKISLSNPIGNSYANDIAEKYGVSYIQMKKIIDNKKLSSKI